uniref:Uncharacterized protein n=1 Tax=Laticauda laticaudata TaxID=8630 RepID=A0A8C5RX12_LATLA
MFYLFTTLSIENNVNPLKLLILMIYFVGNRCDPSLNFNDCWLFKDSFLLDFDSEYQELWDWLIDMESIVIDSHDLMMSEEQQLHLYKRYSIEMSIRHPKKMELLSKVEALKRSGVLLPSDLLEKVDSINEKWELLGVFAFLFLFVGSRSFFFVLKYALEY